MPQSRVVPIKTPVGTTGRRLRRYIAINVIEVDDDHVAYLTRPTTPRTPRGVVIK
jgi:hypothetical protein